MTPAIHLFEPSGYAGVFQHTCRLAEALTASGRRVVLHTSTTHEDVAPASVEVCRCVWWPRGPGARARVAARRAAIAAGLVVRSIPHLVGREPAVVHVQGVAASGAVNLLALRLAHRAGHRVVYSPHDVFSRRGTTEEGLLRRAYGLPDAIVVYSAADERLLRSMSEPVAPVHNSPLIQLVADPLRWRTDAWRREWRAEPSDRVVLCAGFVRPEKRLEVVVEGARSWPPGRRLAVVGPDRGGWARCARLAADYDVDVAARLEFVELDEFTAAIAAADVVVVPSEMASQSGVLAVARRLGTPAVASDVGGMGELATKTFVAGDPLDLNRALEAVLAGNAPNHDVADVTPDDGAVSDAVRVHLRAYGMSA